MLKIRRYQLFEFNDQAWFPQLLRDAFNDALAFTHAVYGPYRRSASLLVDWLKYPVQRDQVLDLASAGGHHIVSVVNAANEQAARLPKVMLSDLFPAIDAWRVVQRELGADQCGYFSSPISALSVPPDAPKYWTIFTALHHFPPSEAQMFLKGFAETGDGLCIAEYLDRNYYNLLMVLLAAPLYLFIPLFSKRNRFLKVLISTLVPIVPALFVWDGLVSTLRTYSVEEIRDMFPRDEIANFDFNVQTVWFGLAPLKSRLIFITRKAQMT